MRLGKMVTEALAHQLVEAVGENRARELLGDDFTFTFQDVVSAIWAVDRDKLCSNCARRDTHCDGCDEGDEYYPKW